MKLFVDDIRACPEGWTPARTVTEAVRILASQQVEEVSLDHDIQCPIDPGHMMGSSPSFHASKETFEAVARFLLVYELLNANSPNPNMYPCPGKVLIHTSNIEAGKNMAKILGIPYVCTHYPYDFRKDRDVKEAWEE